MLVDDLLDDALAVLAVADVALMQGQRAAVGLDRLAQLVGALAGSRSSRPPTTAPAEARLWQIAAPIPRVPPVTSATRPASSLVRSARLWAGVRGGHGVSLPFAS